MTSTAVPAGGPFFQRTRGPGPDRDRFCFFDAPTSAPRGSVLAIHPFAEELNKTRAATADAARALAARGFAVLRIDLAGCGDSAGDFADATWAGWLADLADAWAWLGEHATGPRWLWGTRLGALLADQFAATCTPRADGLLLWQPVVNGAQHLGQFLRLKTVNGLLRQSTDAGTATTPVARVEQPSPRADLAAGLAIEVAGYRLTPQLADAIEAARLGAAGSGDGTVPARVRWFEVAAQPVSSPGASLNPVATKVAERWRGVGSDVQVVNVVGSAFWQTQEIERCGALVDATVEALCA